ncbi:hypothetical protein NEFER03_2201 [Nematocida sp. LUAm3]|nr:hypothetical protein NEFER03_2201 [Nematocida sp. LUAm3]KAI5176421.1 hypothetical protein NEFER02_2184 [Nematocida sp. LUAm2]KAI5179296.1 hypothetical protein NEFER01_2145 [Nematocida sp. LUAm1]
MLFDERRKGITTQRNYTERIVKRCSEKEILEKLENTNVAINFRVLKYMLKSMVTEDPKLMRLKSSMVDDKNCGICGENTFKIAEVYIMQHCGHWMCLKCAIKCAKQYIQSNRAQNKNLCHICRAPAEFDKEFYLFNLKDPKREEEIKAYIEKERKEKKAAPNPPLLEQSNEKPKDVAETDQVPSEDPKETIIEEFEVFRAYPLVPPIQIVSFSQNRNKWFLYIFLCVLLSVYFLGMQYKKNKNKTI